MNSTLITIANTVPTIPGPTTLVLQDADTENLADTYVKEQLGSEFANFGLLGKLLLGPRGSGSPRILRPYIMFSTSLLPLYTQVDNATLLFFLNKSKEWNFYGASTLQVNHVLNYTWIETNLTWESQMCGTTAGSIGGSCNSTSENAIPVASTPINEFYNWSVVSAVKREHTDITTNNISFVVHDINENYGSDKNPELEFLSKEATNTSFRPILDIGYTSIYINVTSFGASIDLGGTVVINDVDGDSQSGTTYKWYKNGVVIGAQTTINLGNANFVVGDVIIFEGTPNDGFGAGSPVNSSSITIVNLLPSPPTILLPTE